MTPFFVKGEKVQRTDTGDVAVVTEDERCGFVMVQYDGVSRPMLQFAHKFKKVT